MKRFAAAAMTIALMSIPAHAQMKLSPGGAHHPQADDDKDKNGPKVDEKGYRSALDRLPAQGGPVDPWSNVRQKPDETRAKKK